MRLDSLRHLAQAILATAESDRLVVFGSAALLGTHPHLGEQEDSPVGATFDADIIPFPFEEEMAELLHESFGNENRFHRRFGYHADIIRPKIVETFPQGWEERLVLLDGTKNVWCLETHDVAAPKARLARPKDANQLEWLVRSKLIDVNMLEERLGMIALEPAALVRGRALVSRLRQLVGD